MLEVIYLIFNEGYSATAGADWMRPALCEEALRLGRVLAELAPKEAEVHGLVALMEIQASRSNRGPYALQAAIAACHARARTPEETDWRRIVVIYTELSRMTPSPIIDLNRSVAVAMVEGPAAGLALVDQLESRGELKNYHLLPSVRGDFLHKLGRLDEARAEFERAASLTRNTRERELLRARAAECGSASARTEPR